MSRGEQVAIGLLIATDTKRALARWITDHLALSGAAVRLIDLSLRGRPAPDAWFAVRAHLSEAATDRHAALDALVRVVASVLEPAVAAGELAGVLAVGGTWGAAAALGCLGGLPVGFPRILLTTRLEGSAGSDIAVIPTVTDLDVPNPISTPILANAIAAIVAMAKVARPRPSGSVVLASQMGTTTSGVQAAADVVRRHGVAVATFHAIGAGGDALERLSVREGVVGILDATLSEIGAACLGSPFASGPRRLSSEATCPRLLVPGAVESVLFNSVEQARAAGLAVARQLLPGLAVGLADERVLTSVALRISTASRERPQMRAVLIPLRGFSEADRAGTEFYLGELRFRFVEKLKEELGGANVRHEEVDLHFCDPEFGRLMGKRMLDLISSVRGG